MGHLISEPIPQLRANGAELPAIGLGTSGLGDCGEMDDRIAAADGAPRCVAICEVADHGRDVLSRMMPRVNEVEGFGPRRSRTDVVDDRLHVRFGCKRLVVGGDDAA